MQIAKKEVNSICAILIIIMLIISDLALVSSEVVSYALDMVKTNNKNVSFRPYFIDKNENKVQEIEKYISSEEYLYVDVTVENEGYFNGSIYINEGNFRLNKEIIDPNIEKIENNEVKLKQISAETTITIKLKIEPIVDNTITYNLLDSSTHVSLSGEYVNSKNIEKGNYVEIDSSIDVKVHWISNEEIKTNLESDVITNTIIMQNNEEKRLIQVSIKSSLDKNSYPLKKSKFKMELGELNVEKVTVHAKDTSSTNSNLIFGEENYNYNADVKEIEINLENSDTNLISWNKETSDEIIVSLILNKDEQVKEKELKTLSELTTYDDKIVNGEYITIIDEEKDGILGGKLTNTENEIYKGNIYARNSREYETETKINVNFENMVQNLEITENKPEFVVEQGFWTSEITYKSMTFSKKELEKTLGENGNIIITTNNEKEILNKNLTELEENENGDIVLNFEEEVNNIKINLSKAQNYGILTFKYTKQIVNNNYNRVQVEQLTGIIQNTDVKAVYENGENLTRLQNTINLLDTTSQASLVLNQENIVSKINGTELTMTVTLKQNEETQDLYLNPKVKIELPETITKINEAKYKVLHKENFAVSKTNILEENGKQEIEIEFTGEQKEYYTDGIDGLDIIIYAEIDVAEIEEPKQEPITLYFENENREGERYKTEQNIIIMPRIEEVARELSQEEMDNSKSSEEGELKTTIYAKRGGKVLKDTDTIYEGEIVKYYINLTNKGATPVKNIEVVGQTQNAIYYDLVEWDVTYVNGDTNPDNILKFHRYGETDWNEKRFNKIETLEAGQSITLTYEVIAKKKDDENILKTTIMINRTEEGAETKSQNVEFGAYKIEDAKAKMSIQYSQYEEQAVSSRDRMAIDVNLKNTSGNKLENVKVHIKLSDGLGINEETLNKIIYKNPNRPEKTEEEQDSEIYGEYSVLKKEENDLILNVPSLEAEDDILIILYLDTLEFDRELTEKLVTVVGDVTVGDNNYSSNEFEKIINQKLTTIEVSQTSNIAENIVLLDNDNLIYTFDVENTGNFETTINLTDTVEQGTNINKVYYIKNGVQKELKQVEISQEKTNTQNIPEDGYIMNTRIHLLLDLKPRETCKLVIDTTVNQDLVLEQKLSNYAEIVFNDYEEMETNTIIHKVGERLQDKEKDPENPSGGENDPNNPDNPNNSDNPDDPDDQNGENKNPEEIKTYEISGICYLDKNKNGKLEDQEKLLSGIEVLLLDTRTSSFIKTKAGDNLIVTTNNKGEYKFENIPEGSYIVVFNYDTGVYEPTKYEADGVTDNKNSKAIEKNIKVDGIDGKRAVTDNILLTQNKSNINLGLAEKDIYDLSLTKTVNKITIINNKGTETNTYNSNLAKAEIHAKYLEGSTAIIEYQISIKNEGEVAGYAKSIVDYKPSNLNFDSKLNNDWYQSGDNLYNTSLTKTVIAPGETRSVTLTLTKTMTESNVGLINNLSEIAEDSNALGLSDRDSTPGNRQKGEDDLGTANVIISIKTGAAVSYISFTLSIVGFLIVAAYLINKKIIKERIKF